MNKKIIMGDGNKVAQLTTENVNSIYSSSMEEAFAKHGYISSDVVAEAETDIGSMFLFKDGLLTDLQSIYISEVPLTPEDMYKAISACLYLYGVYGSQMCTYEQIINELNNNE
jgi:hypothetical protein